MFVGLKMLKNFVTTTPKTLVKDAERLMEQSKLWMLLVLDGEKLVGYVRAEDIARAMPSLATSLSRHELGYLLDRLTLDKIMRKDIATVAPEVEIEAAAQVMYERNLAGLAVLQGDRLIGYINRSVMLDVLVEEMGYRQGGSRISVEVEDRQGILYEMAGIVSRMGHSIISTGTFYHNGRRIIVLRVACTDPSPIAAALQEHGYRVVGAMDFMEEWQ
ncbi:MAG: CBS domain-containing protein [Desulfovibrionaceae bacterium]